MPFEDEADAVRLANAHRLRPRRRRLDARRLAAEPGRARHPRWTGVHQLLRRRRRRRTAVRRCKEEWPRPRKRLSRAGRIHRRQDDRPELRGLSAAGFWVDLRPGLADRTRVPASPEPVGGLLDETHRDVSHDRFREFRGKFRGARAGRGPRRTAARDRHTHVRQVATRGRHPDRAERISELALAEVCALELRLCRIDPIWLVERRRAGRGARADRAAMGAPRARLPPRRAYRRPRTTARRAGRSAISPIRGSTPFWCVAAARKVSPRPSDTPTPRARSWSPCSSHSASPYALNTTPISS